jgi:uncharacterized protein (DUF1501 family)
MQRRDLLKYTGLAGALAAGSSMFRPLLSRAQPRSTGTKKRLICVMAQGGWDQTYALDPKVQSDKVDVPPSGGPKHYPGYDVWIDDSTRPNVTQFFDAYAANTAIVRGISVASVSHLECVKRMSTGTRQETNPDMASIVAHDTGNDLPLPYLILGDTAFAGPYAVSAGRVGSTNQIIALLDPAQAYPTGSTPLVPSDAEQAILARYTNASVDRAHASRGSLGYNKRRVDDFAEAIVRGDKLKLVRAGFGTRGRALTLDSQVDLAIAALSQDISQAVMLNTRLSWDTHTDNGDQAGFHDTTFEGLKYLMDTLSTTAGQQAGTKMIDDTVVVCFSEFSRTPKLNSNKGKDHWPVTSAVVMGAGVKGGHAFGATTADVQAQTINLSTGAVDPNGITLLSQNFVAGVLQLCGVDPGAHLGTTEVCDAFVA